MAIDHFAINAVDRSAEQQGKGASRRLRKQPSSCYHLWWW